MSRFRILVVDDQEVEGWQKLMNGLNQICLVPRHPCRTCPDSAPLAWEIIDSESASEGRTAFEIAQEVIATRRDEFIAFIFDLNLSKNGFLPRSFDGREYRDALSVARGERSSRLAGLDLLKNLPYNERPKIFYTGSIEVREYLRAFDYFESRLDDVEFEDINDGAIETCKDRLTAILDTERRRIVARMPSEDRVRCVEQIRSDAPLTDCFPQTVGVKSWTLSTLFPMEAIRFSEAPVDVKGSVEEEIRRSVLSLLAFDWRSLLRFLMKHPNDEDYQREFTRNCGPIELAVTLAKREDFELRLPGSRYRRIGDFPTFSSDGAAALSLRDDLLDHVGTWMSCPNGGASAAAYLQTRLAASRTAVGAWAYNIGLNPLDLAYLCHVAEHNATKHFHSTTKGTAKVESGGRRLVLSWMVESADDVNWQDHLKRAYEKLILAAEMPAKQLCDEGLGDVCRIVCGRYEGTWRLDTPGGSLEVKLDERTRKVVCRKIDAAVPHIDTSVCTATIDRGDS